MYIASRHGDRVSQPTGINGQLNPTDFKWPTEVKSNGPDGLATSDNRSRTTGAALLSGNRLPATMAHGIRCLIAKDRNGPAPTRRTLKGSDYEMDQEWQLRNMRYGEGWACDSSQSHYKRAKPTYTDPEDDRMTDSSLPIGSTSKTYGPKKDGNFWQSGDSGQNWSHDGSVDHCPGMPSGSQF